MKKAYLIIIAIILIIIVGLVCFKLGFTAGKKSLEPTVAQYKKLVDYYSPVAEESFDVFGEITNIQDKFINIETTVEDRYTLPENWKTKTVKVIITDKTEFTTYNIETGKEIKISFSDLAVGDKINARADKNIKNADEFEAIAISRPPIP